MLREVIACAVVLALAPACIFDLPPLEGATCVGAGCGGDAPGAGGAGGGGASGPGSGGGGRVGPLATAADEVPQALAVAADGDVLVAGTFSGTLSDPSRGELQSRGRDAFVARLAPDGMVRWVAVAGSDLDDDVLGPGSLVELADGDVLWAARLGSSARRLWAAGGDVELPLSTNEDGFVLQLSRDGVYQDLGHVDGQSAPSSVHALAADGAGYWFAGSWGTATSGGLVAKVDAGGNLDWLVTIDGGGSEIVRTLTPRGGGVVAVGTDASGIFAIELDGGGNPRWAAGFGASARPDVRRAVSLSDGRIAVVGTTTGSIATGAGSITPAGDGDGFVLVLSSSGAATAQTTLGDATGRPADGSLGVPGQAVFDAVASKDGLVVGGVLVGSIAAGATPLGPAADQDAFAVRLDASLAPLGGATWGGAGTQWLAGIGAAADGSFQVLLGAYAEVEGAGIPHGGGADLLVWPASL